MKFDPTNGAKAYSYFGTIVKRWLINYNNKNYKKLKKIGQFSDIEDSYDDDSFTLEETTKYTITLGAFIDKWVAEMYEELDEMFVKDIEKKIADAVLTIFKTRNDLEVFRKKALYIYIREITNCETPLLTRVVTVLKEDFYSKYLKLYENGHIVNKLR
tara:strand:- start:190 stop:663 length:474 start_codon:yes stop_codon:yes gene_type:complete